MLSKSDTELLAALAQHCSEPSIVSRFEKLLRQGCHKSRVLRRRFELFDAFRTMRLLHHWREHVPPIEIRDAIPSYSFLPSPPTNAEEWSEWLEEIERERLIGRAYGLTNLEEK